MTAKDKHIWETYTRGVKPTPAKTRRSSSPKPTPAKPAPEKSATRQSAEKAPPQLPKHKPATPLSANAFTALERKREKSLRQGELEIDAKLDLHGLTQTEAFAALTDFMHKKVKSGKRHLLIITGKGRSGAGVLRQNLQHWLEQLPEAKNILALRPAALKHGGAGAFYILLRKQLSPSHRGLER